MFHDWSCDYFCDRIVVQVATNRPSFLHCKLRVMKRAKERRKDVRIRLFNVNLTGRLGRLGRRHVSDFCFPNCTEGKKRKKKKKKELLSRCQTWRQWRKRNAPLVIPFLNAMQIVVASFVSHLSSSI